jgi:hypothetical protein
LAGRGQHPIAREILDPLGPAILFEIGWSRAEDAAAGCKAVRYEAGADLRRDADGEVDPLDDQVAEGVRQVELELDTG